MKNLKFILLFAVLSITFSCSNDEVEDVTQQDQQQENYNDPEVDAKVQKMIEAIDKEEVNYLNSLFLSEEDIRSRASQITDNQEFVDLIAHINSFASIPLSSIQDYSNNQKAAFKSNLTKAIESNDVPMMSALYGMDEIELAQAATELAEKFKTFADKNPDIIANKSLMDEVLVALEKDENLQARVENATKNIPLCKGVCAIGGTACTISSIGGWMRKYASCLGMTGGRFILCAIGVALEESAKIVLCGVASYYCHSKCTERSLRGFAHSSAQARARINTLQQEQRRGDDFLKRYYRDYFNKHGRYPQKPRGYKWWHHVPKSHYIGDKNGKVYTTNDHVEHPDHFDN